MPGKISGLPSIQSITAKFCAPKATTSAAKLKGSDLLSNDVPLILNGWLHRKPKKLNKSLTFINLRDSKSDVIQIVDRNIPSLFKNLKPDSAISVKVEKNGNDYECRALHVLSEANLVPGELQDSKDWPANYRFIQLRQPKFQHMLRSRAKIINSCRSVLEKRGFTEIETPILFKSTPEGAREFLVPTRRKGLTYALPQSPQQYKQLLIASGVDKYFQVAKCFRDEDLRADRQPEFTQLDLEMGFSGPEEVMEVVEDVARAAWASMGRTLKTLGSGQNDRFVELTYAECIANYGIDKPDLRSGVKIARLNCVAVKNSKFPVIECLKIPESLQNNLKKALEEIPRVAYVQYKDEMQLKSELRKHSCFTDDQWPDIYRSLKDTVGLSTGNWLALSDRQEMSYENPTPLGKLRQRLVTLNFELFSGDSSQAESIAVWVNKFPSFEPLERQVDEQGYPVYDTTQLKATHHPFTMVDLRDYCHLENNEPLKCHGMHFDLVIDGVEVGGGSQRIHDSDLQAYILREVVGVKNPNQLFGHLLEALATGCPPHAGLAIGLDRMVAMLLGLKSIRDVIAFPKSMTGSDAVVGSPSRVTPEQLAQYHLKVE